MSFRIPNQVEDRRDNVLNFGEGWSRCGNLTFEKRLHRINPWELTDGILSVRGGCSFFSLKNILDNVILKYIKVR